MLYQPETSNVRIASKSKSIINDPCLLILYEVDLGETSIKGYIRISSVSMIKSE